MITISLLSKGLRRDYPFYLSNDCAWNFIHVVDITKIDFASNHLGAAFNDLGTIFGQALGSKGLGSLISNTSRLPETLMAILAFSLTGYFDTIGTLIGTGEKVGIVATNGENHQSAKLDKALYSDLVATSVGAIAGTSNVTTYVESAAGIGAGGRTGLTALVVAICFAISSLFSPLLAIVPTMPQPNFDCCWDHDVEWLEKYPLGRYVRSSSLPSSPLSLWASATRLHKGSLLDLSTYSLVKVVKGEAKEVHSMIWILDVLFILNYVSMALN